MILIEICVEDVVGEGCLTLIFEKLTKNYKELGKIVKNQEELVKTLKN